MQKTWEIWKKSKSFSKFSSLRSPTAFLRSRGFVYSVFLRCRDDIISAGIGIIYLDRISASETLALYNSDAAGFDVTYCGKEIG